MSAAITGSRIASTVPIAVIVDYESSWPDHPERLLDEVSSVLCPWVERA